MVSSNGLHRVLNFYGLDAVDTVGDKKRLPVYMLDGKQRILKDFSANYATSLYGMCNEVACSKVGQFLDLDVVENDFAINGNSKGEGRGIASVKMNGVLVPVEKFHGLSNSELHHRDLGFKTVQTLDPEMLRDGKKQVFERWPTQVIRNTLLRHGDTTFYYEFGRNSCVYKDTGKWAPAFDFVRCLGGDHWNTNDYDSPLHYRMNDAFSANVEHIPQEDIDKVELLTNDKVDEFTRFDGLEELFGDTATELEENWLSGEKFVDAYHRKASTILREQRDFIRETKAKSNVTLQCGM